MAARLVREQDIVCVPEHRRHKQPVTFSWFHGLVIQEGVDEEQLLTTSLDSVWHAAP